MVFGLAKHIYRYFVPEIQPTIPFILPSDPIIPSLQIQNLTKEHVPIYDTHGCIVGYIPRPPAVSFQDLNHQSTAAARPPLNCPVVIPQAVSVLPQSATLYTRTADGHFVPVITQSETKKDSVTIQLATTISSNPVEALSGRWDGWPDGEFHRDFTATEFQEADELKIHWASKTKGTDRSGNGDEEALSWLHGKKSVKTCLGVITCDNDNCSIVIRPKTVPQALQQQLQQRCLCTAKLHRQFCDVRSLAYKWSGGVHFYNTGTHPHQRPGRVLHLLSDERERFENLVKAHPNTGPLGLIVGVPSLTGPGESAADISDVFLNADRVSKERQKIKRDTDSGGDGFIASFSKFEEEYSGFVICSTLGKVTVISVQTKFMRSNLVKNGKMDGPVNGMVNDAAHGWWKERNSLLMITSAYCPSLFRWVPGVISYTNGASAEHFKYHFLSVFQSIAREADERKISLDDSNFARMMDFSEAERLGFILAYIDFWALRPEDKRDEQELRETAERLLKGCQEHYRAGVTRISRMAGVVKPEDTDAFKTRAMALLDLPSSEDFILQASHLVRDFPKLKSWMEWWKRPSHASMLFKTERQMDIDIWESIPDTNNAEESQNWKFYAACGRNHSFLEGLRSLHAVAAYYECLYNAESKGIPIRYGAPEPWKIVAATIGRTKPTRASRPEDTKRKKNDGRPPDTKEELLQPMQKKVLKTHTPKASSLSLIRFGPPSYPWKDNSCWLDTSLELLFVCVMRNFTEFTSCFQSVSEHSGLSAFYTTLVSRQQISDDEDNNSMTQSLSKHRDDLRLVLNSKGVIENMDSSQPLMAWLWQLFREDKTLNNEQPRILQYFHTWLFDFHNCSGSPEIGGPHIEVVQPHQHQEHILHPKLYSKYKGSVANYFINFMSIERDPIPAISCWRVQDGLSLCPGHRVNLKDIVISLPIILTLEVELGSRILAWDFPVTLHPSAEERNIELGLIYDLVGLVLFSKTKSHFIARYASRGQNIIYTYDGMVNGGTPIAEQKGTFTTHVAGKKISPPKGYSVYQAFYNLRGGRNAQQSFYKQRAQHLSEYHHLKLLPSLTSPFPPSIEYELEAFVRLDPQSRLAWTMKPESWGVEYVSIGAEAEETEKTNAETSIRTKNVSRATSPTLSLPDSLFSLNCRCGMNGDGNILYQQEDGEAIQCEDCKEWSHIACQKDGRANSLKANELFFCDFCDPTYHECGGRTLGSMLAPRISERKQMEAKTMSKKPLKDRLRRGRGALARHGDFWYPVRVIHMENNEHNQIRWKARWWRGCEFATPGIIPDTITAVPHGDVVDSLWGDRTGRRAIRLGRWTHSWDVPSTEDILSDPSSVPYTQRVAEALAPSEDILRQLLDAPETVKSELVPAKAWLEARKKNINTENVPFVGSLSLTDCAQVSNWFETHVSKDKKLRHEWLARLPIAHAYTLYISACLAADPKYDELTEEEALQMAWEVQSSGTPSVLIDVDVDRDCLSTLEEEMFERSIRAGIAGHYQWGLDAGDHHYWDPYGGAWGCDRGDRQGSDTELEASDTWHHQGPKYEVLPRLSPIVDSRPRPKPRPKGRAKKAKK